MVLGQMGWGVINMTAYPEGYLARELELCYANVSLITDYDVGLEGEPDVEPVSHEPVVRVFTENNETSAARCCSPPSPRSARSPRTSARRRSGGRAFLAVRQGLFRGTSLITMSGLMRLIKPRRAVTIAPVVHDL